MAENELQILIKGIFSRIKEKYGYTDEQALIYLKGYEDCAEEHQQSLEKRDKMLRDTVEELCEAKQLLKASDVQPVRCGEWEIFHQNGKPKLKCTNCHSLFDIRTNDKHICIYPKFCEECGADMREEG